MLDAFSYGFRVAVVEDAVCDRAELAHAVNLFDMDQKYAKVMPADSVAEFLYREPDVTDRLSTVISVCVPERRARSERQR